MSAHKSSERVENAECRITRNHKPPTLHLKYNPAIVLAFWRSEHLPPAVTEYKFHPARKWRFDFAFVNEKLAVEVQGGIYTGGRHTRGAALKKEWEKLNLAAIMGWRILYCEPREVCGVPFARLLTAALA